ncbi:MAG: cytochrome c3 family protein [candidate division Zixibacteria bacterium]
MKKLTLIISSFAIAFYGNPTSGHIDNFLLPEGCGSCHVGHGETNQPMLAESEERFCFQCHGSDDDRSRMISEGKLSPAAQLADLDIEFSKPFHHPVEEGFGHSPVERLPSASTGTPGHAECVDCHNPHQRIEQAEKKRYEVSGYSLTGQYLDIAYYEYEICLKCHVDYFGYDGTRREITSEFSLSSASQHSVTKPISGEKLPSLTGFLSTVMKCSDCHTNDDPGGPRGPHGSNNQYLLSGNYNLDAVAEENPYAYEFCYSCHDRLSILNNESFPYHREHISGDTFGERTGTSCYTCHASHGSRDNSHLIEFNPIAVSPDPNTGLIRYNATGEGGGECYLTCHGQTHSPGEY